MQGLFSFWRHHWPAVTFAHTSVHSNRHRDGQASRYSAHRNTLKRRIMKKATLICLTAILAITANTPAQADWGRHHGGHRHHHRSESTWIGPAAVLAITGMAIGAAAYNHAYATPAPVYTPPPTVYPAPPVTAPTWYYCGSSGQYYPYTNACPEGWQAVPAR